jgi:hypothetical protein
MYGMAIRGFRWSTENKPEDIMNTRGRYSDPNTLSTVAMAEVMSGAVPVAGMAGMDVVPTTMALDSDMG